MYFVLFLFLIIMRPCLGLSGDVKDGAVSIPSLRCMHAGTNRGLDLSIASVSVVWPAFLGALLCIFFFVSKSLIPSSVFIYHDSRTDTHDQNA